MKSNEKLTIQSFLDMPLEDFKNLTINNFVELCDQNNLDFAEVIKQIKYKFDVQDNEMQNKQAIYSNLKDNVAIVQEDSAEISADEYIQIKNQCFGDDKKEKFIIECLQSGLTVSKLQRYFYIGFHKASQIVDKLMLNKMIYRADNKYVVTNNKLFIETVCSPDFLVI